MIVEDEMLVRVGLRSSIDWESIGISEVIEANNGVEALHSFYKYEPQIIISDIKMPHMDGIEMLKEIRKKNKAVKVIYLTCFNTIDYVKDAMRLGANDFIDKTTLDEAELEKVLSRLISEIREQDINTNYSIKIRESILWHYLQGYEVPESELHILKKKFKCKAYNYFYMDTTGEYNQRILINMFKDSLREGEILVNAYGQGYWVLLNHDYNQEELESILKRALKSCMDFMNIQLRIMSFPTESDFMAALISLRKNKIMSKNLIFYPWNSVYLSHTIESMLCNEYNIPNHAFTKLSYILKNGDHDQVATEIDGILDICKRAPYSYSKLCHVVNEILMHLINLYKSLGLHLSNEKYTNLFQLDHILKSGDLQEISHKLYHIYSVIQGEIINDSQCTDQKIISTQSYINAHYMDSLTLDELASKVYVSKGYLSSQFKKTLGISLMQYINSVRINKAKELILFRNMKLYEVAEAVGVKDVSYFCRLFKRIEGITPKDFYQNHYRDGRE